MSFYKEHMQAGSHVCKPNSVCTSHALSFFFCHFICLGLLCNFTPILRPNVLPVSELNWVGLSYIVRTFKDERVFFGLVNLSTRLVMIGRAN